jgi:hypothetical protein
MIGFTAIGVQLSLAKVWTVGGLPSGGDRTTRGKVWAPRWLSPRSPSALCGRRLTWASDTVGSPLQCNHNANREGDRTCTGGFM